MKRTIGVVVVLCVLLVSGYLALGRRAGAPPGIDRAAVDKATRDPAYAQAQAHAARGAGYANDPRAAAAEYRKALHLQPHDRQIKGGLAFSLHQAGDDAEAAALWRDLAGQDDQPGRQAKRWLTRIQTR